MKNRVSIFMLFAVWVLSACASSQLKKSEIEEIFVTDIKPNGLKLFSYSVTMSMPQKGINGSMGMGMSRGGGMGGGMPGGKRGGKPDNKSMMNMMEQKIHEMLDSRLAETRYCRDGYIELDSNIGRGRSQIRGECKEGATKQDREMFSGNEKT